MRLIYQNERTGEKTKMPKIDAAEVVAIFTDCLFRDEEVIGGKIPENAVIVDGVLHKFGFHGGRIAEHAERISEMLHALPSAFQQSGGGGMSFLNACDDSDGEQWTGLHQTMGNLFDLGVAAGKCKLVLPREMWAVLPGGMPYYVVL